MNKNILGIDIGTSSVKTLLRYSDGQIIKSKATYEEKNPRAWINAIKNALLKIDTKSVDAVSFSSQVGTYIINDDIVIGWDSEMGKEECEVIFEKYKQDLFVKEISMPHPKIISYPIPRLLYIVNNYKSIKRICQPKDYIINLLTGNYISDKYSWRGLANIQKCTYSKFFLDEIGIKENVLPKLTEPDAIAGTINKSGSELLGLSQGIPVYVGLNDFFSSVYGMDIDNEMFDITGTSEHIGYLCNEMKIESKMVSGKYFDKYIHYGVTASSGASLDFAIKEFGTDGIDINEVLINKPPIFTPYLNGERAPIFDTNARGVMFGINSKCSKKEMAYAVLEGVVFSLYHIYESMGSPEISSIRVSGGASLNDTLNLLKAEIFNKDVSVLSESDTSALGAVKIAGGIENNYNVNSVKKIISPCGKYREILLSRYNIYKDLYNTLKLKFCELNLTERDCLK